MKLRVLIPILCLCVVFSPAAALAQWQLDGAALSTAADNQQSPVIAPDGTGGAIVTWVDYRSGNWDLYAQRVDASGVSQWAVDGVALCTAASTQNAPAVVSDGAGGAIVTWKDSRSGTWDIYAQRVNASGAPQWTANGVALCTAANDQERPTIVPDGAGGAIVTWEDRRTGVGDIYAQRVNASGVPQWTANGVPLCTAANEQSHPTIAPDGSGGAIVTWNDYRGSNYDIYAQRVNASGVPQWTANGVALCTAANDQVWPTIVPDGSGGAIVTWQDDGAGGIYSQRVNASGVVQWTANGVALCTAADFQTAPTIAPDGSGGAIVTWYDYRSGTNHDIYAQRVNASGAAQWTANGVALCITAGDQYEPTIVSDGSGGAIVTWNDNRRLTNASIYAQRVNASGVVQWTANGVALCTAAVNQNDPTIVSDGAGGAIVTWCVYRSGNWDIYAQRIEGVYGYWYPRPSLVSVADVPGDQGGRVKVNWTASSEDVPNLRAITHYSVWRATDALTASAAAAQGLVVHAPSDVPADFQGRAVWKQRATEADYYWEWLANLEAHYLSAYSYTAATRSDSTGASSFDESYFVSAHTSDPFVFFDSNVVSGHSVDNLAPAAPLMLTAQRVGSDVRLRWNRVRVADLRDYSVYRATSSGVTPVPVNFLSSAEDTVLIDASAPSSALYYIVTARDVHANQSASSNEASVNATTGVGDTPAITALTVLQNHPNPFAGTTDLSIGLPAASSVEIEVYDVAGRRVRAQVLPQQSAGWRSVPFDGRDDQGGLLPSGVYFYRVRANGTTVSRKMVIAR